VADALGQAPAQWLKQVVGGEAPVAGQQHRVVLVELARHPRPPAFVVEGVLHERLDVGLLLLHHEDLHQTPGEVAGPPGTERDGHVHAHEPDAGRRDLGVVGQSQPAKRLAQLPVGDPRGHDPDPGVGRVDGGVVEWLRAAYSMASGCRTS